MMPRDYLFSLEQHGIKLGLDNINLLLEHAGRPYRNYPCVHVGGTNGKGSVAAFLDAMLRAAGYSVGKFTSPHLIDVSERFLVNGEPIVPDALDEAIAFFRAIADTMASPPTFFEMNTAIAFRWFHRRRVDIALIEVGMGGRFDSTNVIRPVVAAITNIGLEHTKYLGDTLEQIAFEKAGILKEDIPAVLAETAAGPLDVILARAQELHCPVRRLDRDFTFSITGGPGERLFRYESPDRALGPVKLALSGAYQGRNAALAVAAAEDIMPQFPNLDERAIVAGLENARWPCRLETVMQHPRVIVDAAHNPASARVLAREMDPGITVLAVSADKDASRIIEALTPVTRIFVISQFAGPRALPANTLAEMARAYPSHVTQSLDEALELALSLAGDAEPVLITGSIFTAGEARALLTRKYGVPPIVF